MTRGTVIERRISNIVAHTLGTDIKARRHIPFLPVGDVVLQLEGIHLRDIHQTGMVVLMALKRGGIALDRIGNKHGRFIVGNCIKGIKHRLHAMTAQIGHQIMQGVIIIIPQKIGQCIVAGHIGCDLFAPCGPALESEGRIDVIWHIIKPFLKRLAARLGKGIMKLAAIFDGDHVPANRAEEPADDAEQMRINHPIKALTVIIDHPPDIANVMLPGIKQGFVNIAFIKFGIPDKGDHAAGLLALGQHVFIAQIILCQGCEIGHRRTKPDRAGGKINLIAILGPRRIGLRAAK